MLNVVSIYLVKVTAPRKLLPGFQALTSCWHSFQRSCEGSKCGLRGCFEVVCCRDLSIIIKKGLVIQTWLFSIFFYSNRKDNIKVVSHQNLHQSIYTKHRIQLSLFGHFFWGKIRCYFLRFWRFFLTILKNYLGMF